MIILFLKNCDVDVVVPGRVEIGARCTFWLLGSD